jgi:hypothetical protein
VWTSDEGFEQPGGPVRGEVGRGVRGGCEVLIGVVLMAITREKSTGGFTPATVSRNGERGRRFREEGDDMRGPPVGVRRGEVKVPVRGGALLGRGLVLAVGWNGSRGPVSYFSLLCFLSFSNFLNSFIDFAKNAPNQFKPLSEVLQKLLQGFKSVGNKFSKIKTRFLIEI